MMWIPKIGDFENYYKYLQDAYPKLRKHRLMKQNALKAIVNSVKYGRPVLKPTLIQRATILLHDLIMEHCYSDGNKRIAFLSMVHFLCKNGYKILIDDLELIEFILDVASGQYVFDELEDYLGNKIVKCSTTLEIRELIKKYDKILIELGE